MLQKRLVLARAQRRGRPPAQVDDGGDAEEQVDDDFVNDILYKAAPPQRGRSSPGLGAGGGSRGASADDADADADEGGEDEDEAEDADGDAGGPPMAPSMEEEEEAAVDDWDAALVEFDATQDAADAAQAAAATAADIVLATAQRLVRTDASSTGVVEVEDAPPEVVEAKGGTEAAERFRFLSLSDKDQLFANRAGYQSFVMDGCELLVAETSDGRLDLSDCFLYDTATSSFSRPDIQIDAPGSANLSPAATASTADAAVGSARRGRRSTASKAAGRGRRGRPSTASRSAAATAEESVATVAAGSGPAAGPAHYQCVPWRAVAPGEVFKGKEPEVKLLRMYFIGVASQQPYRLDLSRLFAFDSKERRMAAAPVEVVGGGSITDLQDPILRIRPDRIVLEDSWRLPTWQEVAQGIEYEWVDEAEASDEAGGGGDAAEDMPGYGLSVPPDTLQALVEAGVIPAAPGAVAPGGAATDAAAVAAAEDEALRARVEELEGMEEFDDMPDVPAVDMV